jgi:thymidylate synthase
MGLRSAQDRFDGGGGNRGSQLQATSDTLDGLMRAVLASLLGQEELIKAHRGNFKEAFGACLHLTNPLARLSRSESKGKIYSALGEFLWYLSGDTRLDFIDYYVPGRFQEESDDQVKVRSGYGDRLRSWRGLNQIDNVIHVLSESSTSRRAVIQLFDASDVVQRFASIPCTCTLQFLVRGERLHLFVTMRSNDAFIGLPHDIFAFTMLQELVARSVGTAIGEYKHCAGSLHLYERDFEAARQYLNEGWQDPIVMPAMPPGPPWQAIEWLQTIEEAARRNTAPMPDVQTANVDPYWRDMARLLLSLRASKERDSGRIAKLKEELHSDVYRMFLMARFDQAELSQPPRGVAS